MILICGSYLIIIARSMSWEAVSKVSGNIPAARAYHTTSLIGNKFFVFGGRAGNRYFNDLHSLNLGKFLNLIIYSIFFRKFCLGKMFNNWKCTFCTCISDLYYYWFKNALIWWNGWCKIF